MATQTQKCGQCKNNLLLSSAFFKEKKNGFTKICIDCLDKQVLYKKQNTCHHGKIRFRCVDCDGISVCEHKRQRGCCKLCNDPIHITVLRMISHSKAKDKKYIRFDGANFIDYEFVLNLIQKAEDQCYYCCCELQYMERSDNMGTIERLDNAIGHTKGNCVIACLKCNLSCVGDTKKRKRD